MLYYQRGSVTDVLTTEDLKDGLKQAFDQMGSKKSVLAIPPDFTRFHSFAGELTQLTHQYFGDKLTDVLPALGTHTGMTDEQIEKMFTGVPKDIFRLHDWRNDVVTLGEVPSEYVRRFQKTGWIIHGQRRSINCSWMVAMI
jgi:nickel-dependent lactate racemase